MKLMNFLGAIGFMNQMSKESIRQAKDEEWALIRPLRRKEKEQLKDIGEAWDVVEDLSAEIQAMFTEERRIAIKSRRDLTDEELELEGRYQYALGILKAAENAFWSSLRYEFRHYAELKLSEDKTLLYGRGNCRAAYSLSLPNGDACEIRRIRQLMGEA